MNNTILKKNRADIKRETFEDHPAQTLSRTNIQLSGSALAPWGYENVGSLVLHYYQKPGTHDYTFITQLVDLHKVPEGQADVGLKEARRSLMGAYGREDKRRKDTEQEIL